MELVQWVLVVLLGVATVVYIFSTRRAAYRGHLQQLKPGSVTAKKQLVKGVWTREEVAKHTTAEDMWVIIRDKPSGECRVYDLSSYVDEHPGGLAIMYNAGGDATAGFHGPQHPDTVFELVKEYCIGTLADP